MPLTIPTPDLNNTQNRKWKAFLVIAIVGILVQSLEAMGINVTPEMKQQIIDFLLKLFGLYIGGNVLEHFANVIKKNGNNKTNGSEVKK